MQIDAAMRSRLDVIFDGERWKGLQQQLDEQALARLKAMDQIQLSSLAEQLKLEGQLDADSLAAMKPEDMRKIALQASYGEGFERPEGRQEYSVTRIVRETRSMHQVSLGASPRAGVMLMLAAKAQAVIADRDFATPDDVKNMAIPVLRHRILLLPEVEVEGRTPDDFLKELLLRVEVPR